MLSDAGAALSDPQLKETALATISSAAERVGDELTRYDTNPRAFVFNEMLAGSAILLVAKERIGDDSLLLDGLEDALLSEPLAENIEATIGGRAQLGDAQRERLGEGFKFLQAGRWVLACDLLLKGIEGAIWDSAEAQGVIDERRFLTDPSRRQLVKSPSRLITEGRIGAFGSEFERFVDKEIFGTAGHDLRHARSNRDERRFALLAAVAVLGWLDHHESVRLVEELAKGLDSYLESLATATAA